MTKIDDRIAKLQFENKDFERRMAQSSKSLTNFDSKLSSIGSGVNLTSNIGDAVTTITSRFSILQTIGVGALLKIGSQAVMTGQKMLNSLMIQPVTQGFEEYELKINSVKTILASAKTNEGLPVTLDLVNRQLQALNKYSDDTIYSFSDMTNNIGKFTNAGVGLEDAVQAIKGIANAAALSGANSNEASRAMYNFAQALSAGYVKLIDWKSIENANMATVGFKQELIDSAVAAGTLTEAADGLYKVLGSDETLSATKGFNESLTDGWMTTEVLTKTLQRYSDSTTEVGKKATEAATKVRTWSQLLDTTKEAVGSGWAQTFELLIGNFDEATRVFSSLAASIGAVVGKFSDARNNVIAEWVKFGGRTATITGLTHAFKLLGDILTPVVEAFKSVFSSIHGDDLSNLSRSFLHFVDGLKVTRRTIQKIQFTFKGLFDLIYLGWEGLKVVFEGLKAVILPILPAGGKLLDLGEIVGKFFSGIRKSADDADIFQDAILKIQQAVSSFYKNVSKYINKHQGDIDGFVNKLKLFAKGIKVFVVNTIDYFKGYEDDLKLFVEKIKKTVSGLKDFYTKAKTYFSGFSDEIEIAKKVLDDIITAIKDFYKRLTSSVDGFDKEKIHNSLVDTMGYFTSFKDKFTATMGSFKTSAKHTLDGITKVLEPFIKFFKDMFSSIREALGKVWRTEGFTGFMDVFNAILTGGLLIAMKKFSSEISKVVGNLSDLVESADGFVGGLTGILDGVKGSLTAYQNSLKGKTLLTIAAAIGILALSLLTLSMIDPDKLTSASVAMGALFVELSTSMAALNGVMKGTGIAGIAASLVAFSVAILILAKSISVIAKIPADKVSKAMGSLTALLAELIATAKLMSGTKGFGAAALALIGMTAAIRLLVLSIQALGNMDVKTLSQGLVAVGEIAAGMAAFAGIISKIASGPKLLAAAGAMTLMGVALLEMSGVVATLGVIHPDKLNQGLTSLGLIMTEVAAFSVIISNTIKPVNLAAATAAMVGMGVALGEMSGVVAVLGNLSQESLIKGLVGLAAGVGVMVGALILLSNPSVIVGASAMVVMAGAVALLTPALIGLGKLSWEEIAKAMVALVGAFAIFGGAAALLTPVIPVLFALGVAMALLGVGIAGIGAGLALFGTAITAISAGGTASISMFVFAINEVIALIPNLLAKIGEGIIRIAKVVAAGAPVIADAIISILSSLSELLAGEIPKFIKVVMAFLSDLLAELVVRVPEFVDAGMKIIFGFLKGIADNIGGVVDQFLILITNTLNALTERLPELIKAGADFVAAYLKGIGENSKTVIDAGFKLMVDFINGLADSTRENTPLVMDAVENLATAFLDGFLTFFGITNGDSSEGKGIATAILNGLINGIKDGVVAVVDSIVNAAQEMIDGFKNLFGINSPSTVMAEFGHNIINGLIQGIEALVPSLKTTVRDFVLGMLGIISEKIGEFRAKARSIVTNFISGIKDKASSITSSFTSIIKSMYNVVDVNKFIEIGKNIANGIIDGIKSKINDVLSTVRGLADSALDALRDSLGIHSPSKAFSEIGKYSALGMATGIQDYGSKVADATKAMAEKSVNTAKNAMGKINDALTSGMNNSPVITPVLDLASIKNGASSIADMFNNSPTYGIASDISARSSKRGSDSQNGGDSSTHIVIENNFNLSGITIRSDEDINSIADKLYQKQQANLRGRGLRSLPAGI